LFELRERIRNRNRIQSGLGFDRRRSIGRGLIAMFTGSSGTGKTMAAELLASEHKVDLYKIDLSSVISKYVGETEKNLSRVFEQAEDANAILFFDEADALFGKRGEVKEAKDRWANIEVNYLLQRIEEYAGVVILASNLRQNIDEAFLRQLEGEELIHLKQSSEGELVVSFEDAERVRVALMLIGELDVNLAGVEVIMHMREDMLAMQRQVADILDALVDEVRRKLQK